MRSIAPWRFSILSHIVDIPVAPAEEQTVFQVTYSAPAAVIEYVTPSPAVDFIAPAPSVTHVTPSEQFSPSPQETAEVVQVMPHESLLQRTPLPQDTVEVVQIGFVHPPGFMTVVKPSASHVVGSLLLLDEFATPVHQEQIACEQIVHYRFLKSESRLWKVSRRSLRNLFLSRPWSKSSTILILRFWKGKRV